MKGVIHGIKVSQFSLILIGFVCATVVFLAWPKTPFLASFTPTPTVVHLDRDEAVTETANQNSYSVQTETKQRDLATSSEVQPKLGKETVKDNIGSGEILTKQADSTALSGKEQAVEADNHEATEVKGQPKLGKDTVEDNGSGEILTKQADSTALPGKEQAVEADNHDNLEATEVKGQPKLGKETVDKDNGSGKILTKQADSTALSGIQQAVKADNHDNLEATEVKESPGSAVGNPRSEEVSEGERKSNKKENHVVKPESSSNIELTTNKDQTGGVSLATKKEDCKYGKGKWVVDDSRPLYSGYNCKQWLSPMWACRLTQRKDFEYEKLRWRPKECTMEEFAASNFLKRMQDKTLAFVGDSLGRQQFQSLMCMLTGGEERSDVLDVGREFGLVKARHAARPDGWAYRFPITNTTILYYWSASLCDLQPIDASKPATDIAMHMDRPPSFVSRYLHKFNVLVLNTGHHWNRGKLNANRWIMYVGGVPNTNRRLADISRAKNFTIHSIVKWVDSQLPLHPGLKAFFRTISPRHFFNGDWNTGGTCDNTTPLVGGKEVLREDSSDPQIAGAVSGTRVKLLDITALSELRDEGHISRYSIKSTPGVQDCLHWCLPGVPDTWNEILFSQL